MVILHRVKTEFTGLAGAPYLSQMYFNSSFGTAGDATTVADAFWRACAAVQHENLLFNVLGDVDQVDSSTGQLVGVAQGTASSGQGTIVADVLPFATQALVRWRTGVFVGGREIRGKTFIPGLTELQAALGQLSGAAETALQGAADGVLGAPANFPVIYSRKNLVSAPISSTSVWNQFAVLRSRRD